MGKLSIVEYFSDHSGYECGYCKSKDTNFSHGLWAHSLTVDDYQQLIDRGWRRSGKYCYQPSNNQTCCPQYTIKCAALDFKLTKSNKKLLKRNNKFLSEDIKPSKTKPEDGLDAEGQEMEVSPHDDTEAPSSEGQTSSKTLHHEQKSESAKSQDNDLSPHSETKSQKGYSDQSQSCDIASNNEQSGKSQSKQKFVPKPGTGADPNKPQCKKAKVMRSERKQKQDVKTEHPSSSQKNNEAKTLEDFLQEVKDDGSHKLQIRLVRSSPRSEQFNETFDESYQLYKKYQMAIHKDPPDKITERQYTRFLVDSPLEPKYTRGGAVHGYGSFHQQYVLDGKIVAVGVIDILPHAVSSVYLYYDPDYNFLALGIYSALRELAFVRQLHIKEPSIVYYYMGFYIHFCTKMKYKGHFKPSFLLCPESYEWFNIDQCLPRLDANKYNRFDETGKADEDGQVNLDEVLCLHEQQLMPYVIYKALNPAADDVEEVTQYASLTGMTCARRMSLYRASHRESEED